MACYGMVWIGTSKCIYAVVYMHPFLCFVINLKIILMVFFGYLVYLGIFRYDILWLTFVKYNQDMTECRIYLRVIHKASLLHGTYDPSYTCITKTCFPRFRKKLFACASEL